jgi:hypothetical protein
MKRFTYLISLSIAAFAIAAIGMVGCEGPAGPAGQAGADGVDGVDGIDANETCKQCHNEKSDLLAKQVQAGNSAHMTGGHFERSSASCAACHTHEGYMDRMASGEMSASMDIEDATPPNCRTCHMIHEMYDSTDYQLRYDDPVELWVNNVTVDYGSGNTCANCHQPRTINPYPESGGADVSITSSRWGPHHGPQGALAWGTSAYEIAGDVSYPAAGSSTHASTGCATCHMVAVEDYGNTRGGHTFNMTYDDHGDEVDNVDACVSCHSGIGEDFDLGGVVTAVTELYDSIETILLAKGWIKEGGSVNASSSTPLVLAPDDAGALLNYRYILEDGSHGIHNPAYIQALLKNSIQHLSN